MSFGDAGGFCLKKIKLVFDLVAAQGTRWLGFAPNKALYGRPLAVSHQRWFVTCISPGIPSGR